MDHLELLQARLFRLLARQSRRWSSWSSSTRDGAAGHPRASINVLIILLRAGVALLAVVGHARPILPVAAIRVVPLVRLSPALVTRAALQICT